MQHLGGMGEAPLRPEAVVMPQTASLPLTDADLVGAVRAGSTRAFERVVSRYEAPLTAYARQILGGSHHDAEEVVQDAFVKALGALRRDVDREIALKPWLYAITRNACLDRLRRNGARGCSTSSRCRPSCTTAAATRPRPPSAASACGCSSAASTSCPRASATRW